MKGYLVNVQAGFNALGGGFYLNYGDGESGGILWFKRKDLYSFI